jgi:hypothetical protein
MVTLFRLRPTLAVLAVFAALLDAQVVSSAKGPFTRWWIRKTDADNSHFPLLGSRSNLIIE